MAFSEYIQRVLATVLLLILLYTLWSTRSILILAFASVVIPTLIVLVREVYSYNILPLRNVNVHLD